MTQEEIKTNIEILERERKALTMESLEMDFIGVMKAKKRLADMTKQIRNLKGQLE